ncbi:GNAT family N-acetyltransferase [Parerythrobacter aurantius]|uniref:GNAT family N-acetyltransferase n=1 Tax=Parerythrobacter aurantius TaxID=3127706 RepID=UPI0032553935
MSEARAEVTIRHHAQGQGGKYVAEIEGSRFTGTLEWEPADRPAGDVRIATHTIVPREIGGRGIARQLVERLVADARTQGFVIVPQCSYVARMFDRHPEWATLRGRV